ncbi:MAG: hypothetical protein LBD82_02355 [Deltaproteobacteria bacterium]|nr:hypothetical protein [Deltaproteobacteria bacterium]
MSRNTTESIGASGTSGCTGLGGPNGAGGGAYYDTIVSSSANTGARLVEQTGGLTTRPRSWGALACVYLGLPAS